ncbi:RICIN domain-containing protein [Streptomyces cirratus]|nr:RICIN domain-containing protein [Streptomyces cirratus]
MYTLTGVASGRALDVPGGQGTNGARVQVADSSGGANQHRNLG